MIPRILLGVVVSVMVGGPALAAVSTEEAKRLGADLTGFGAIKAGNADGLIPEYAGGSITPPATYTPGSGQYPNPFADEQPLFTITAANMEQYADRLDEGTRALLKRWPDTFELNVYPTHRTASYPDWVLDNTRKNAVTAQLVNEQGDGVEGAYGGIPFPIPQNGLEVLWNHVLYWQPIAQEGRSPGYLVDRIGSVTNLSVMDVYYEAQYYNAQNTELNGPYYKLRALAREPARVAGEGYLTHYPINHAQGSDTTWAYSPGQRRVRLAPEFKYDTPSPSYGGGIFFDEVFLFSGRPDRFEWKLIGKKEMIIPYNAYDQVNSSPEQLLGKQHVNPELLRWELHRVWEVEATLKEGARHAYKTRKFYFDEDSWKLVLSSGFDQAGDLFRVGNNACFQVYDPKAQYMTCPFTVYDLNRGQYVVTPVFGGKGGFLKPTDPLPAFETTSSALQGSGIR